MYCASPFYKYFVCDMPTIDKHASSVPGLIHGKRPVSLGQLEEQLKKNGSCFSYYSVWTGVLVNGK